MNTTIKLVKKIYDDCDKTWDFQEKRRQYSGRDITVGHRTCPTNLAQRPIENDFFCLMSGQCVYLLLKHNG